jgi:hypothetical protein
MLKLLCVLETFISNPWVDLAIACLLVVIAWKMNQTWANVLLVFSWVLFVFSVFRIEPLSDRLLIERVLWTGLFATVSALLLYYTLWTIKNPANLPSASPVQGPSPRFTEKFDHFNVMVGGMMMEVPNTTGSRWDLVGITPNEWESAFAEPLHLDLVRTKLELLSRLATMNC